MLANANPANFGATASWQAQGSANALWSGWNTRTVAPDGSTGAMKLVGATSGAGANHTVYQSIARSSSVAPIYTFTVFAKAAEIQRILFGFFNNGGFPFGTAGLYYGFDLVGGQIGYGPSTFGAGFTTAGATGTITPVGNGWYKCQVIGKMAASSPILASIALDNGTGTQAQANTFAGDNTSGVYLWNTILLPSLAMTIGTQKFLDDFTSLATIDTNNTQVAGFNWYTQLGWKNSTPYSNVADVWTGKTGNYTGITGGTGGATTIQLPTDYSTFSYGIATACAGAGPTGTFVGQSFSGARVIDASMAFDFGLSPGGASTSCPSFWSIGMGFLSGLTGSFDEYDVFQGFEGATGSITPEMGVHDWEIVGGSISSTTFLSTTGFPAQSNAYANQNRYSMLIVPASVNGGTGIIQSYFNGVLITASGELVYSTAGATYAAGDNQSAPLILGAGPNWPATFDYARVFTTS